MAKVDGSSSRPKAAPASGGSNVDAPRSPGVPGARLGSGALAGLDALQVDALVLPLFEGARQPQGVAGYVDWRLSGRIARLLGSGRFRGARGEHLLMSSLGRLGAERVFLLGLGPVGSLAPTELLARVAPLYEVVRRAGARVIALGPPAGPGGSPAADDAEVKVAAAWLEASRGSADPFTEVQLLDVDGRLADGGELLAAAAKRGGLAFTP